MGESWLRLQMIDRTVWHQRALKKLGNLGTGVVCTAEAPGLRRAVALEPLSPMELGSEDARRRFLGEARTAASLTPPAVASTSTWFRRRAGCGSGSTTRRGGRW